MVALRGTKQG